jgi:hypothetical protein
MKLGIFLYWENEVGITRNGICINNFVAGKVFDKSMGCLTD